MSSSLLRGLSLLEGLAEQPAGVSELARRLGVDKAGVSRTLALLAAEGWVLRVGDRYRLGPRAAALRGTPAQHAFTTRAAELAHLLSGLSGMTAYIAQLAGERHHVVASASSPASIPAEDWSEPMEHWATAVGVALLAQLPPDAAAPYLESDPWPRYAERTPGDRAEVERILDEVRRTGIVAERGWVAPGVACIAATWPDADPGVPTAFALIGYETRLDAEQAFMERVLRAAVAPGATRESVIAAAHPVDP